MSPSYLSLIGTCSRYLLLFFLLQRNRTFRDRNVHDGLFLLLNLGGGQDQHTINEVGSHLFHVNIFANRESLLELGLRDRVVLDDFASATNVEDLAVSLKLDRHIPRFHAWNIDGNLIRVVCLVDLVARRRANEDRVSRTLQVRKDQHVIKNRVSVKEGRGSEVIVESRKERAFVVPVERHGNLCFVCWLELLLIEGGITIEAFGKL
jgi:hypothetical protein